MLDDEEFQSIMYKGEGETLRERMFSALLGEYERVTGFHETNPNAIYHHKLSLYGPACSKRGKPLRTRPVRKYADRACKNRAEKGRASQDPPLRKPLQ